MAGDRARAVPRPQPARLPGVVRALAGARSGCSVFTWIELGSGWGEEPATLATAVAGYSVLTLIFMGVFGVEPWSRLGETFSVYFNLFSRLSVFETRDRVVGTRPFLGGLPRLDPVPGTVAMVIVMIGTVTFDGLSQGQLWKDLAVQLNDGFDSLGFSLETTPKLVAARRARDRRGDRRRLLRAGHRGRALGRRRPRRGTRCGARSPTASCRSRWSTSPRTT